VLAEIPLEEGWVDPALEEEFRGLRLRHATVDARPGRSPRELKQRLRHLSDRVYGEQVVTLRRQPIESAYRIFFRQVGIDPEEFRTPVEATMVERLRAGHFRSRNLVDDALTVALVETGVALRALNADALTGAIGLRASVEGERLGGKGGWPELAAGSLVVADEHDPVALIFGDAAEGRGVDRTTRRITICAVQVQGVPDISVEESIWTCANILKSA
jgi:DNA/RNA-binding domain of Phe-tRNA-synthetase-like protein